MRTFFVHGCARNRAACRARGMWGPRHDKHLASPVGLRVVSVCLGVLCSCAWSDRGGPCVWVEAGCGGVCIWSEAGCPVCSRHDWAASTPLHFAMRGFGTAGGAEMALGTCMCVGTGLSCRSPVCAVRCGSESPVPVCWVRPRWRDEKVSQSVSQSSNS